MTVLALTITSEILGTISTLAWSISFYFQVWEVVKVKSSKGLSINFIFLNFIGFYFYTTYNIYGYIFESSFSNQVHLTDVIFASHALLLICIQFGCLMYYPRGDNHLSYFWVPFGIATIVATALYGIAWDSSNEAVVKFMGIMKVVISFVKYCPQVYLNWKRKNTEGWSLENVLLDFTGGVLSFLQIYVDYLNGESQNLFDGGLNIAKFLLSIVSIVFDLIFMFQHFILYNPSKKIILGQNLQNALAIKEEARFNSDHKEDDEKYSN